MHHVLFVTDITRHCPVGRLRRTFEACVNQGDASPVRLETARSLPEAVDLLRRRTIDAMVISDEPAGAQASQVVPVLRRHYPHLYIVMVMPEGSAEYLATKRRLGVDLPAVCSADAENDNYVCQEIYRVLTAGVVGVASRLREGATLRELISRLCLDYASVRIQIRGPASVGQVQIREGQVVDARDGAQIGVRALAEMLAWPSVDLAVHPDARHVDATVPEGSWEYVLHDMLKPGMGAERGPRPDRPTPIVSEQPDWLAPEGSGLEGSSSECLGVSPLGGLDTGALLPRSAASDGSTPGKADQQAGPSLIPRHMLGDGSEADCSDAQSEPNAAVVHEVVICEEDGMPSESQGSLDPDMRADLMMFFMIKSRQFAGVFDLGPLEYVEFDEESGSAVVGVETARSVLVRSPEKNCHSDLRRYASSLISLGA